MDHHQPEGSHSMPHIMQMYPQHQEISKMYSQSQEISKMPNIIHIPHPSLTNNTLSYQQMLDLPQNSHQISHMVIQHQDLGPQSIQQVQVTSQLMLPELRQPLMIPNTQHYYEEYGFQKVSNTIVPKLEPAVVEPNAVDKVINVEITPQRRKRKKHPEPESWACNIRKEKHQRGEAYINRRGKYVPERKIKNTKDCLASCIHRCSENVGNTDRENIFKAFYSLTANEKKHYLLNSTERNATKQSKLAQIVEPKRKYCFKYYFTVRSIKYNVCKKFYLGTLAISQRPVYNVHELKSETNIPKPDGRGLSERSTHGISNELKENVRKHIMSFTTFESKPIVLNSKKKQFLEPNLNFKKLYSKYLNECSKNGIEAVKECMYRTIFKKEFNLDFRKVKMDPEILCSRCKGPVRKSKKQKGK